MTGGAGFIGSALVWELIAGVSKTFSSPTSWAMMKSGKTLVPLEFADYFEADRCYKDIEESPHLFDNVTTVFHLGACSRTTERDAAYLIRNNFEYSKALAHFALQGAAVSSTHLPPQRTASWRQVCRDRGARKSPPPQHVCLFEAFVRLLRAPRRNPARITGLKYFNVFGPNEDHKGDMRSVVHKAFHEIGPRNGARFAIQELSD